MIGNERHVENLILYHSEDHHIENRKFLYKEEGKLYQGSLYIPDELETLDL